VSKLDRQIPPVLQMNPVAIEASLLEVLRTLGKEQELLVQFPDFR